MNNTIPARIIQTGKTRDLSLLSKAAVANLKCLNPEFEHVYFDDADVTAFIRKEFPQYQKVFENFPYKIQKFDFLRYLAVFRLGGFYFDLDVLFAAGLQDLLKHGCVFPFEELTINQHLRKHHGMDWEIGNYAFGAAAGHPFLNQVIQNCVKAQEDPSWVNPMMQSIPRMFRGDYEVLNTTGPGLLSRTLAENPALAETVTVLFPKDVCDISKWHQFGEYGVHLMEGSWRGGSFLRRRLRGMWETRARDKALAESRGNSGSNRTRRPITAKAAEMQA